MTRSGALGLYALGLPAELSVDAALVQVRSIHDGKIMTNTNDLTDELRDLREQARRSSWHHEGDQGSGRAYGLRQSWLGMLSYPGRAEEGGARCRAIDDCEDAEGTRDPSEPGAAYSVANFPSVARWRERSSL